MSNINRLESLDWLRGMMAISILLYHSNSWLIGGEDSSTTLGRFGIYGVSIFFILSGLSMGIVYSSKLNSFRSIVDFFVRRFFRIVPLLAVVCMMVGLGRYIAGKQIDEVTLFLNMTGLFGIFDYSNYIAVGAWSIGNEVCYYLLTPFIIYLYDRNIKLGNFLFLICIFIAFYFSEILLSSNTTLAEQWSIYINPFNNLFLYVGGLAIYFNLREVNLNKKFVVSLLLLSGFLFVLYPIVGDTINIVTGSSRLIFCLASFFLVISFYKLNIKLHSFLEKPLNIFGMATYGVYLIHPIVYQASNMLFDLKSVMSPNLYILYIFVVTLMLAIVSYYKFEMPLSKLGKKLSKKYLINL